MCVVPQQNKYQSNLGKLENEYKAEIINIYKKLTMHLELQHFATCNGDQIIKEKTQKRSSQSPPSYTYSESNITCH